MGTHHPLDILSCHDDASSNNHLWTILVRHIAHYLADVSFRSYTFVVGYATAWDFVCAPGAALRCNLFTCASYARVARKAMYSVPLPRRLRNKSSPLETRGPCRNPCSMRVLDPKAPRLRALRGCSAKVQVLVEGFRFVGQVWGLRFSLAVRGN